MNHADEPARRRAEPNWRDKMRRILLVVMVTELMFAAPPSTLSHTMGQRAFAAYPLRAEGSDVVMQSSEEALAQDLALVAKGNGWTPDEAAAYEGAEQALGRVAKRVAAELPDVFVGSALSLQPRGAPTLYIKGPAGQHVRHIVDDANVEIDIADNQPYSFDELEARKIRVHRALLDAGFRGVVTGVNITGAGVIKASVSTEPGLADTVNGILSLLPNDLKSSVDLTIRDVPIVAPAGAFGGMKLQDDGAFECTSGWTVQIVGFGTRGVSGAGHCTGINQINHPGHGVHAATWQNGHEGQWGDVEWYVTPEVEADDFYADAATIRDVTAVELRAGIAKNEFICVYGRASNSRKCDMQVKEVSLACGSLNRLVQMDEGFVIGGDSGGGWSFDNRAYGVTFGSCDALDSFTVADLFDEALGVFVPTV